MKKHIFFFGILSFLFWTACNLEKEIDIDLPEYDPKPVVECYLEPGQPFFLLISRSSGYFDPFPTSDDQFLENLFEDGADVTIHHKGDVYTLQNQLIFNPITEKAYNYFNPTPVPAEFDNDFELEVTLKTGKTITAVTKIKPAIPIDSVVLEFETPQDTLGRLLTYMSDPIDEENYIRRMVHHNSLIDSIPEQDFPVTDRFLDDNRFVFGTAYDYPLGDSVYNTMIHIDREYYDFLNSIFLSIAANGNPFAQPSTIISNVEGTAEPIGIFTGIGVDRVKTVIKK